MKKLFLILFAATLNFAPLLAQAQDTPAAISSHQKSTKVREMVVVVRHRRHHRYHRRHRRHHHHYRVIRIIVR